MNTTEIITILITATMVSLVIRLLIAHPIFGETINKQSAKLF